MNLFAIIKYIHINNENQLWRTHDTKTKHIATNKKEQKDFHKKATLQIYYQKSELNLQTFYYHLQIKYDYYGFIVTAMNFTRNRLCLENWMNNPPLLKAIKE